MIGSLKKIVSKSYLVLKGIMVIKEKRKFSFDQRSGRVTYKRWFKWRRLGGSTMETGEGLRWTSSGDRGGFGWVDDGGKEGIGVTGGGRRRFG